MKKLTTAATQITANEGVFIWILSAWVCALFYFNPRLLALMYAAPNAFAKFCVVIFVLCLDIFWLYAVYNSTMIVVSIWLRRHRVEAELPRLSETPAVAILYTTKNDFQEGSVDACLSMDYPRYHLFILDDSSLPEYGRKIDAWAQDHVPRVTVLRRKDRSGFKAGNLNHALAQIKNDYPYFAVCDADGILPSQFIAVLLPYFYADPEIAFVQSAQECNPGQRDAFGQALGYAVIQHYRHFVRAKNRFGFVMFYGHGALLKTSVWEKVGGFPEIVTEDLAYAAKVRELGLKGVYSERVVCQEDFPPSYAQLRIRTEKWIRGTSEFMKTGYADFFRSPRVPWYEKVDVAIGAFSHYQAGVMLVFLFMLGTLLPTYYAHFRYPGSFFLMPVPEGKSAYEYLIHIRYHIFWAFDFYLMMAVTMIVPLVPAILDLRKTPLKLVRYIALSNFIFLSGLVSEAMAIVTFLFTGKAVFRNTLDGSAERKDRIFHPNSTFVLFLEIGIGAALLFLGFETRNLWLMAPAIALILSPLIQWTGWRTSTRSLAYIPFSIGTLIFGLVTLDLFMTLLARI